MGVNSKGEAFDSASIYVQNIGFIAAAAKGTLPVIEFVQVDMMSGVSEHTIDTSVLKKMTANIELLQENTVYIDALAKRRGEKASIDIKYTSNGKPYVVTLRGNISKLSRADVEVGKENKTTIDMSVDFFKKEVDGTVVHLIDVENMICELNGTDIWADQRQFHLG